MLRSLVGSEMCIRDSSPSGGPGLLPGTRRGFVGYQGKPDKNGEQGGYAALLQGVPDRRESFTAGIHPYQEPDRRQALLEEMGPEERRYFEQEGGTGRLFMQNIWPDNQVGEQLRSTWSSHYQVIEPLVENIYTSMGEILGFAPGTFRNKRDFSEFQANYYLATAPQPGDSKVAPVLKQQTRMCPHKDGTDFTLIGSDPSVPHSHLTTAPREGREALPEQPNVPFKVDTLVILIGTAMEKWSNGRWYAPVHKVEMPSEQEYGQPRVSMIHFLHSDYDKTVTPPPLTKPEERKYLDMTVQDHFWSPFFNGPPKSWLEPLAPWRHKFETETAAADKNQAGEAGRESKRAKVA
eukprot:TRINITY_DN10113_c0_g1_i9.p1 TRINITY_DN10113_c0_g1~~TRINITY_DN10113_c0_g1_i9.p1  ORF type:complete len:398 (-),score=122.18 TRINITY_DN10113_c0_g1_i9:280-1329(-)